MTNKTATKREVIRDTVAGILIRFKDDGTPLLGYHRSPQAGMNFTTVGGGVRSKESTRAAMKRELLEEYGYASLDGLNIIELDLPDIRICSSSGQVKRYHRFLIVDYHRGDVTQPNPKEVAEIRWHPLAHFHAIIGCFTQGKQEMLLDAIAEIYRHHTVLLERQRAA